MPFKNLDAEKEYQKKYRQTHKESLRVQNHNYYEKNKFRISRRNKEYQLSNVVKMNTTKHNYQLKNPWMRTLTCINYRCSNPKAFGYSRYGGRGIKNLLTAQDLKYLWLRDAASKMKQPSIDRIDNNGNYCLENCRYIERSENSKRHKKAA